MYDFKELCSYDFNSLMPDWFNEVVYNAEGILNSIERPELEPPEPEKPKPMSRVDKKALQEQEFDEILGELMM